MNKKLLTGTGVLLAVVLFFAINILGSVGLRQTRIDLTENKLFTLSEGSRNLLRGIKDPIQLRFFYSKSLASQQPQIATYGDRVRELLEQYASLSGGKVRLEIVDPEPFSDAEDRAVQAGLESADVAGRKFFFGLVGTNSIDTQEVVAFFAPEREQFLEYDLTKLVYNLTTPKKPVVGIISSLPLEYGPGGVMAAMRGQSQPYGIMQQLRQFFEVRSLEGALDKIDAEIGILVLAHPKNLSQGTIYAIDQFVMRGGRVVAFVDPFSETAATLPDPMGRPQMPGADQSSNLPELFKSWGVTLDKDVFVADLNLAQRVQANPRTVVDYVAWLAVPQQNLAKDDLVTGQLNTLNLASAGALRRAEGATTTFAPLITSSDKAMLVATEKIQGMPDPQGLLEAFKPTGERYVLAARLTGPMKSAFPNGAPPAEKKEEAPKAAGADDKKEEPAAHLAETKAPGSVIVIADVDMLDDRFWAREQNVFGQRVLVSIAGNADLLVNAIDNLSGSNDLISLRSRGRSQRPFDRIEEMRKAAGQEFTAREKALRTELSETEKKITELQSKNPTGGNALLSAEESSAIDGFRQQLVKTRQELRAVQRDLNKDISRLETWVKFINIGLIPILVGLFAVGMALMRRSRRRRPVQA
jgi:ABC-type uncharacterized transport system involved in gliding motility auxiliary subunit